MNTIVSMQAGDILFLGNKNSIVAVKIANGPLFIHHVERVKNLYLAGELDSCIGWQVYQSLTGLPFEEKTIGEKFIYINDFTRDFNRPEDYDREMKTTQNQEPDKSSGLF